MNGRGKIEVLLVTSRGSGHWIPPKGWPMPARTAREAARPEALEEAGVSGIIGDRPIGRFDYRKKSGGTGIHRVTLYPLMVTRIHEQWDEQGRRDRRWFTLGKAAAAVEFPHLKDMLLKLHAKGEAQETIRCMLARAERCSAFNRRSGEKKRPPAPLPGQPLIRTGPGEMARGHRQPKPQVRR